MTISQNRLQGKRRAGEVGYPTASPTRTPSSLAHLKFPLDNFPARSIKKKSRGRLRFSPMPEKDSSLAHKKGGKDAGYKVPFQLHWKSRRDYTHPVRRSTKRLPMPGSGPGKVQSKTWRSLRPQRKRPLQSRMVRRFLNPLLCKFPPDAIIY